MTEVCDAPAALRAALWLDAWLAGLVGADDLLAELADMTPDAPQVVHLPEAPQSAPEALLRAARRAGARRAWPVLSRPGRPLGWPRSCPDAPEPAVLLVDATPAGQLLVRAQRHGWQVDPATDVPVPAVLANALTPRAAGRRFSELLAGTTEELLSLGLDRPGRGVRPTRWADAVAAGPGGLDPDLVSVLTRIAGVRDALDLALDDDGAAVTAREAAARRAPLLGLRDALEDLLVGALVGAPPGPSGHGSPARGDHALAPGYPRPL